MSKLAVTIDGTTYEVVVDVTNQNGTGFSVTVDGQPLQVDIPDPDAPLEEMDWIVVDGRPYELTFDRDLHWIKAYNAIHHVEVRDQEMRNMRPHSGDGRVKAPIPGLIARVLVEPGQHVQAGDALLVLEAMKMENEIRAQRAGVVHALHVHPGQSVARHEVLVEIT